MICFCVCVFLFKITPALKKYVEKQVGPGSFVIISTCSGKQAMCVYFVPLSKKEGFYMGNELTAEYGLRFAGTSALEKFLGIDFKDLSLPSIGIGGTKFGNVSRGLKKLMGFSISGKNAGKAEEL